MIVDSAARTGGLFLPHHVAGHKVVFAHFPEYRVFHFANISTQVAACMEPAARRRVDGAGHITGENYSFLFGPGVGKFQGCYYAGTGRLLSSHFYMAIIIAGKLL